MKTPIKKESFIPLPNLSPFESKNSEINSSDYDESIPILKSNFSIPRISPLVLSEILLGKYDLVFDDLFVIDCRFNYEFNAGHIQGAINFQTQEFLINSFFENPRKNTIFVFHCEFSVNRGPTVALLFRQIDRFFNTNHYPNLFYPKIYILDGGFKLFFKNYSQFCEGFYLPMSNKENIDLGNLTKENNRFNNEVQKSKLKNNILFNRTPLKSATFKNYTQSPSSMKISNHLSISID